MSVCLSVSVILAARITRTEHGYTSSVFTHVACTMVRSYSDGVAIGFVDDVMFSYRGPMGPESSTTLYFKEVLQVAAPVCLRIRQLQCLVEFIRMRHRGRNLLSTIALFVVKSIIYSTLICFKV